MNEVKCIKKDVDNLSRNSSHSNQSEEPTRDNSIKETTQGKQEVHKGPPYNIPTGLSNLDHNGSDGAPSFQGEDSEIKREQPDTSEGVDVSGQASDEVEGIGKPQVFLCVI